MNFIPWYILLLPLVAAGLILAVGRRDHGLAAGLSIAAVVGSFLLSIVFTAQHGWNNQMLELRTTWLSVADLHVEFGLRLDSLSQLMMLIVTGVASLIHIYSWGYLRGDPGLSRFYGCLSLFTFSMLGIVLANNFVQLFIFWELVGVSSYLLIGYWYERPPAADAGKKAFIVNRLGDFGFLIGILLLWSKAGSVNFIMVKQELGANPELLGSLATAAGLLIFCGAAGKSAQFPLHVWLPDAMEGPTPVSALIHAATMVAAGVYMLCRVFFVFQAAGSHALEVISYIGGFTALLAALIAVQQNGIKRILAYSTLSQLGYMVMTVGLGGTTPAMYHLATHAFFKALLFLGAGAIIVAAHHEQDIWRMGGLRKKMPVTFWTFLAGTLALAGLPPLSGFYSKDAILAQAWEGDKLLFGVAVLVSVLTTFYMFRLFYIVFTGASRSEQAGHAEEVAPVMAWPLRFLAVMSVIGGWIGLDTLLEGYFSGYGDLAGRGQTLLNRLIEPFAHSPVAAIFGLVAIAVGFFAARALYAGATSDPLPAKLGTLAQAMRDRFYFDEIYEKTFVRVHEGISQVAAFIDKWLIAGLGVRGTHGVTEISGRVLRLVQNGNLQMYAFLLALGVAILLCLGLFS